MLREVFARKWENPAMGTRHKPESRVAFARRLEAARIAAGYDTKRSFANALGIEEARYTRYERAETEPDIPTLVGIKKLTGVSLDVLLSGTHS